MVKTPPKKVFFMVYKRLICRKWTFGCSFFGFSWDFHCLDVLGMFFAWIFLGFSLFGFSWDVLCLDFLGIFIVWIFLGCSLLGFSWDFHCLEHYS